MVQARERRGTIACETCDFDFEVVYGELGAGFIHVHHVVPLHFSGEVETTLEHLVLLCANCHQMIHRGPSWKTPEELRGIILASRAPTNANPTE
nr:HNH endonuclease [Antrihabitans stalactiti]